MTGFLKVPTQEHIDAQYTRLLNIIVETFGPGSERTENLLRLYGDFEDRIKEAPASGKFNYHNAYPGGYLDHVLHVHDIALRMASLYLNPVTGGVQNFTKGELVFCALHHDLGKLGTETDPQYVLEHDQYWIKKGFLYKQNDFPLVSTVYERTIYLLQKYNVNLSLREMVSIKLTDGMYDEGNKRYFLSNQPFAFDTALPYIMHWSDHMATIAEKDEARRAKLNG